MAKINFYDVLGEIGTSSPVELTGTRSRWKLIREFEVANLEGSEKQNEWAESLRFDFFRSAGKMLMKTPQDQVDVAYRILDYIAKNYNKSKFWIDNKNNVDGKSIGYITAAAAREMGIAPK